MHGQSTVFLGFSVIVFVLRNTNPNHTIHTHAQSPIFIHENELEQIAA